MKNTRIVFFIFLLILSGQCLVFADSFKGEIYYKFEPITEEDLNKISIEISETHVGSEIAIMSLPAGIQYYNVFGVRSSRYNQWEWIDYGQNETVRNHGGAEIIVSILRYGYGNTTSATLDAAQGGPWFGAGSENRYVCGPLSNMYFCSPGETVKGQIEYYKFTGKESGFFSASAYSIAAPYGGWNTSVYIK